MIKISIITVCYNSAATLEKTILSVANQTYSNIEYIIVDGNKFNSYRDIPHKTIVKGDAKYLSIAAASVLAKTYRDEYMEKIHKEFTMYNWKKNKGYPTKEHRNGILKFGITKYHRKTFKLLPEQLTLEL